MLPVAHIMCSYPYMPIYMYLFLLTTTQLNLHVHVPPRISASCHPLICTSTHSYKPLTAPWSHHQPLRASTHLLTCHQLLLPAHIHPCMPPPIPTNHHLPLRAPPHLYPVHSDAHPYGPLHSPIHLNTRLHPP